MLDFKLTEDGDIDLSGGDLELVEPTSQHVRDLLLSAQGSYKENPETGVDSINYMMDSESDAYLRKVRKQCVKDGMTVEQIFIEDGELTIEATYGND